MNTGILKNWMPFWAEIDDVTEGEKQKVRDGLKYYLDHPIDNEIFTSTIQFRVVGEIYGSDRFEDGDGIMTSPVKEIRRVVAEGVCEPTFDVVTQNSIYRMTLRDSYIFW